MHQLLNHPHLSAHIDETDEDALSYMTDLEVGSVCVFLQSLALVVCAEQQDPDIPSCLFQIESFKNNKLGYRIRFHFRRNPYFQNNIIMKELHLGMGGKNKHVLIKVKAELSYM